MKRIRSSIIAFIVFAFVCLVVTACSGNSDEASTKNIKDLVHDYSSGKEEAQSASITSHQLKITGKDGKETVYDLPEGEFFLSIAPFVHKTHECSIHSLTGCQGEMANKEFEVYIEDMEGNVVLDKTLTSQSNGFIDLWLPRNKEYKITITNAGKKAESVLSTYEGDNTCITTMQLS